MGPRRPRCAPGRLGALVLAAALVAACAPPRVVSDRVHDDRTYPAVGARETVAVVGDSLGMGLARFGAVGEVLQAAGWGPVRTRAFSGLRTAAAWPGDTNTVPHRLGEIRAEGYDPAAVVVVTGVNDVGAAGGSDPAVAAARMDTAMAAIGDRPTVWLTLQHPSAARRDAWNGALAAAATRHPALHVCDWSDLAAQPGVMAGDGMHLGPTGYRLLAQRLSTCLDAATP